MPSARTLKARLTRRHHSFLTQFYLTEVVQSKGVDRITVEELINEIKPEGRGALSSHDPPPLTLDFSHDPDSSQGRTSRTPSQLCPRILQPVFITILPHLSPVSYSMLIPFLYFFCFIVIIVIMLTAWSTRGSSDPPPPSR